MFITFCPVFLGFTPVVPLFFPKTPKWFDDTVEGFSLYILSPVYIGARIILLVVAFCSLSTIPATGHQSIEWASFPLFLWGLLLLSLPPLTLLSLRPSIGLLQPTLALYIVRSIIRGYV